MLGGPHSLQVTGLAAGSWRMSEERARGPALHGGLEMFRYLTASAIVVLPFAVAAAQSDIDKPRWMANIARHQKVIMYGVPAPYTALRDPTPITDAKLRRGAALFDQHCSSCHGWTGQGTGPEGQLLVPAPADLEWLARTPRNKADAYIYWSIAEGGKAFNSEMPPFKQSLSRRDIWAVTAYLRAGMPHASP
jgi:mono/diheme cytochrome c family protein